MKRTLYSFLEAREVCVCVILLIYLPKYQHMILSCFLIPDEQDEMNVAYILISLDDVIVNFM